MTNKELSNRLAARIKERFAIKEREGKLIINEIFEELHLCFVESDEIRLPKIGNFKVKSTFVKKQKRWLRSLQKYIDDSYTRFWFNFEPTAEVTRKMKIRKQGSISSEGTKNKELNAPIEKELNKDW